MAPSSRKGQRTGPGNKDLRRGRYVGRDFRLGGGGGKEKSHPPPKGQKARVGTKIKEEEREKKELGVVSERHRAGRGSKSPVRAERSTLQKSAVETSTQQKKLEKVQKKKKKKKTKKKKTVRQERRNQSPPFPKECRDMDSLFDKEKGSAIAEDESKREKF